MRLAASTLFLVALAPLSGVAHANDSVFGGAGADLVPLAANDVEMRSEDVVLTAEGTTWTVRARYVFFNHAAAPLTLQVGFPEYRCDDAESDCSNVAFRGLFTQVDGKPVTHRSGTLDRRHEWAPYLGTVWLFDVTFPSRRELAVEHSYSLPAGTNVMGDLFTTYVTRTGATWKNAIGSARFTAVLPPYAHTVANPKVPGANVRPPRLVSGEKPRVELVIEARDWSPKGEIGISFNANARIAAARLPNARATWRKPVPFELLFPMSDCASEAKDSPDAARDCTNLVYAAKGYPFKSKQLALRYYAGKPDFELVKTGEGDESGFWVRTLSELRGFRAEWFDREDRSRLSALRALAGPAPSASGDVLPVPVDGVPVEVARSVPSSAAVAAPANSVPAANPVPATSGPNATNPAPAARRGPCACVVVGSPVAPFDEPLAVLSCFVLAFTLRSRRGRRHTLRNAE